MYFTLCISPRAIDVKKFGIKKKKKKKQLKYTVIRSKYRNSSGNKLSRTYSQSIHVPFSDECPPDLLCTEAEVMKMLQSLDTTKSSGPDGISAQMLKSTAHSITPSVTQLFNLSITADIFPDKNTHILYQFLNQMTTQAQPTIDQFHSCQFSANCWRGIFMVSLLNTWNPTYHWLLPSGDFRQEINNYCIVKHDT